MRMNRRLGGAFHGDAEVLPEEIRSFRAVSGGSSTVQPYATQGVVGAFTSSTSALIYTNTRIDIKLKHRTKMLTVSALWDDGSPNSPSYVGLFPGDYPENRAVYYYHDYLVGHEITIERRSGRRGGSVTAELVPDTPLPAGDYCIYFYARPSGAGGVSALPAEQVSIIAKS